MQYFWFNYGWQAAGSNQRVLCHSAVVVDDEPQTTLLNMYQTPYPGLCLVIPEQARRNRLFGEKVGSVVNLKSIGQFCWIWLSHKIPTLLARFSWLVGFPARPSAPD